MTRPLRLVAVSGGLQRPSKSAALAEHLSDLIADEVPCEQRLVELGQLAPQLAGAVWRSQLPGTVERELAAVEQADVLVVATPVFRGAYTGLFKHFFDFVQARTLPLVVYATDKDFVDYRLHDEALIQRAALAVQRALPLVELMHRARPCLAEAMAVA
jgi:FMN reductase